MWQFLTISTATPWSKTRKFRCVLLFSQDLHIRSWVNTPPQFFLPADLRETISTTFQHKEFMSLSCIKCGNSLGRIWVEQTLRIAEAAYRMWTSLYFHVSFLISLYLRGVVAMSHTQVAFRSKKLFGFRYASQTEPVCIFLLLPVLLLLPKKNKTKNTRKPNHQTKPRHRILTLGYISFLGAVLKSRVRRVSQPLAFLSFMCP